MLIYNQILEKILSKKNLSPEESEWLMNETMEGTLTSAQIAGWLTALRAKGESSEEIASFAKIMRKKAVSVNFSTDMLLDTCGTGGDKSNLMNISTLSAITLASMGIPVAKHGNKAVSSSCGSADILEKLGYPLNETAEQTTNRLKNDHFAFFFAPLFHPAMKNAATTRKELGIRTVFNILGPLSNPASASVHLLGVFDKSMIKIMAEALLKLNVKTAMVISSDDGLDEISPIVPTYYALIDNNNLTEGIIDPAKLDISNKDLHKLKVNNAEDAFQKAKDTLKGSYLPGVEAVSLNSCAAYYLWQKANNKTNQSISDFLRQEFKNIKEVLLSGKPYIFTEKWLKQI
ncbi:MAG: anthranilate phosphoribosyltransferase [Spirochaetia bacterium]|nr:anthranilate phosphoribosyltransferase [Spirochaetia bacterium]